MAYAPYLWRDNSTGGTPITAARLNAIEQGIYNAAAAADSVGQVVNGINPVTGWFHVTNFGATGDGVTIDRTSIQTAINAANSAYGTTGTRQSVYFPPGVYLVDAVNYTKSDTTVYGAVSLMLLDGVDLIGPGTIKVKSGAYGSGAFYGVIRSKDTGLSHSTIRGLSIDGNTSGNVSSGQCNNILLVALTDVSVEETRHPACNGNVIQITGVSSSNVATNIRVNRNVILAGNTIGIQVSQFDGIEINSNVVYGTADNCIDVYGENGSATPSGTNFQINNNFLRGGSCGVFLETVAHGQAIGNVIKSPTQSGVHVNRINGAPSDILVSQNTIIGGPLGMYVTGDTGGVTMRGNTVSGSTTACVQLGGGGNCSYVYVIDNSLDTATQNTVPLVSTTSNQIAFNRVRGTITFNTNRSLDLVNTATTSVGNTFSSANVA